MISRKYLILISMVGMLVSFDQLSKLVISNNLNIQESWPIINNFINLTLVHNVGAAFGTLKSISPEWHEPLFLFIPLGTLALIFVFFIRLREHQNISALALSIVSGGAIGNIIDRLRLGYVIDFIDLHWKEGYHFPVFNIADIAISAGVLLLFLGFLLEKEPKDT